MIIYNYIIQIYEFKRKFLSFVTLATFTQLLPGPKKIGWPIRMYIVQYG